MFNTNECADCEAEEVDEALKGNQHKIDANKNGKVDAHDFKLIRGKKGVKKEEAEQANEYKLWRPEEQRSDKGNAFTKKGIEKGKTTPTAKQKVQGDKAVARYKINRGLAKNAKLEA